MVSIFSPKDILTRRQEDPFVAWSDAELQLAMAVLAQVLTAAELSEKRDRILSTIDYTVLAPR
jgi:hypothetical protein